MKIIMTLFTALFGLVAFSNNSFASLISYTDVGGDTVVYDDVNQNYWFADLSHFVNQTYGEQIASIGNLNTDEYYGLSGWHLATYAEMAKLWGYMPQDFANAFDPSMSPYLYQGRYDRVSSIVPGSNYHSIAWVIPLTGFKNDLSVGAAADDVSYVDTGAWVVANSPAPVPEPTTMLLLSTGLVGLAGLGRNKFMKR